MARNAIVPLVAAVAALAVILLASSSGAALLEVDLLAPGDGLVTRDTETGLDWLDLTVTTNLSKDDILAGAGNWTTEGWRYADEDEMCELALHFAIAPNPCPGPAGLQPGWIADVNIYMDFVGETGWLGLPNAIRETTGWYDNGIPGVVHMALVRHFDSVSSGETATTHIDHPVHTSDEAHDYVGSHLVRVVTECNDGIDNDGDGRVDWNGGPSGANPDIFCIGGAGQAWDSESTAQGAGQPKRCGLIGLVGLSPAVLALRRGRRSSELGRTDHADGRRETGVS